ncbi:TetR/AcrR family transcriptional regulator [Leisingera sp.]|uniref:TetR/AcrR family transcriptional regulator n=1 Tax=Leisingera sp. TaxID=1879318 RepID=UPI002B2798F7|nr:TetR/AcrR family transcriptional regulator [Leisingera sp.]
MTDQKPKPARGRPRTITRDRIAHAGIEIGLPNLTFIGVANALGVSQVALYKRVDSLEDLRTLVAEEAFLRWPLPDPAADTDLTEYMHRFSLSIWHLVYEHSGIAPYLLRRDWITEPMMQRTYDHQRRVADRFGLTFDQSNRVFFTIAYHCIAVADASRAETPSSADAEQLHGFGIEAMIAGVMALIGPQS